ncbi:acyl-CoA thioesterase [Actinobacillus delphinicola]|uniref:Thioesterase superfamily protein n=1 Tax=Actinobacillus delphinicola TaxID=51161 RepID=A0A448TVG5_9PAST|nr:acyl-CoA thioester hydrolase YciA [Actinobacillus delphinicola]MDG6898054.1 acyl-CoA thioesterase [Actinobacillus delphinicola]VEJ09922.1 thioesterase superfamily protein [Actinobacillus delphinicola]
MSLSQNNNPTFSHPSMPLLRTVAMPADTNANGDIFGGWIMSQMDLGGAILAKEIAHGRVVTVSVENITFLHPVAVGDVICCYGKCLHVGRSSIKLQLDVWAKKVSVEPIGERFHVTTAIFTFVAVDKEGKPREVPRENNPELEHALAP